MVAAVLNLLFGCRHRRVTRPITPAHRPGTRPEGAYVACLDCGKTFQYDLQNMRVGGPVTVSGGIRPTETRSFQSQY